jgi:hypothetical protein
MKKNDYLANTKLKENPEAFLAQGALAFPIALVIIFGIALAAGGVCIIVGRRIRRRYARIS